jgi:hypothetical protein
VGCISVVSCNNAIPDALDRIFVFDAGGFPVGSCPVDPPDMPAVESVPAEVERIFVFDAGDGFTEATCPVDPPNEPARKSTPATYAIARKRMLIHRTAVHRKLMLPPSAGSGIPVPGIDPQFHSVVLDIPPGFHVKTRIVCKRVCGQLFH